MSATTGRLLTPAEHLRQSIRDVLTTRVGTRIMRRDYGSRLPELVDRPFGEMLVTDCIAETAIALARWEPRVRVEQVTVTQAHDSGRLVLSLVGKNLLNGEPITVEGIIL